MPQVTTGPIAEPSMGVTSSKRAPGAVAMFFHHAAARLAAIQGDHDRAAALYAKAGRTHEAAKERGIALLASGKGLDLGGDGTGTDRASLASAAGCFEAAGEPRLAADLFARHVDDRRDDVRRAVVRQLHDVLAEVGLDHLEAGVLERLVEVRFLRGHRLALRDPPDAGPGRDVDTIGFARPTRR